MTIYRVVVDPIKQLPRQFIVNLVIWLAIACVLLTDGLWICIERVHVDHTENIVSSLVFIILAFSFVSFVSYKLKLKCKATVYIFSNVFCQLSCQAIGFAFLSYLAAHIALPLVDAKLIRADAALGFDWLYYIYWVDTWPASLLQILKIAYYSFLMQAAIMPFLLLAYRLPDHAQRFIIILFLSVLSCIVCATFLPALGGYNYYGIDVHALHHIDPTVIRADQGTITKVRTYPLEIIFPLKGIICFPSFHAAGAILLIYLSAPMCCLRWLLIPFNILMLVSCPHEGGHYLVDVLAGVFIAFFGIYVAERMLPR
jgi:PAP2 superfamily